MSGKIEISREQIDRWAKMAEVFDDGGDGADPETARTLAQEIHQALTAPVVERQEPVAWIKPDVAATLRGDECCYAFGEQNPKGTLIPLYASPPAPLAAVPALWEVLVRDEPGNPESTCEYVYVSSAIERDALLRRGGASVFAEYACLDKVKELNQ